MSSRRPARGLAAAIVLGPLVVSFGGCRPEAAAPAKACDDADDCADGEHCADGRCRANDAATAIGRTSTAKVQPGRAATTAPRLAWDVRLGAAISTTPAIASTASGPVAVVGDHAGRVVGVIAEGEGAGRLVFDTYVDGIVWSSPLAAGDGRVYFGADDDRLYAIDLQSGTIAWRVRLGDCSPPRAPGPEGTRCDVDGGPVPAPGGDLYVGADGLYRVRTDGTVRWHHAPEPDTPAAHVSSTPLVTDELVVFGAHDGFVTALDHDGRERWRFAVGADVDGSAVVAADGSIVIGADGGRVTALDPENGSLRWAMATGKDVRSGITRASDGTLFATSLDGHLYALGPGGGVRFVVPTQGPVASTPVIDAAGTVFFGSRDDRLYAVTTEGRVLWNLELPDDIDGSVAIAPQGTLVVGCDDGHLRGLR